MAGVILSLDDVRAAAERLSGVAHRTPVLTSHTLDERTGATAFLKAECLQRGGSFKFRGAYNMISSLGPDERAAGVVAYSSGNHAQAVSLAARIVGTSATILMPADTPAAKLDATRGYGAEVVTYDRYTEDREALGAALAEERGLVLVPPYEHPLVMAGQGTAALELLEDVSRPRRPPRARRRRGPHRRLRDGGEGDPPGHPRRSASSPRPATTRAARSRRASASASPSRARSPTASRPTSPAS